MHSLHTIVYFIVTGGCLEPQTLEINISENLCIKPAGHQIIIECKPGEVPEEILSTCQENGSWIPDEMECSGE